MKYWNRVERVVNQSLSFAHMHTNPKTIPLGLSVKDSWRLACCREPVVIFCFLTAAWLPALEECASCGTGNEKWKSSAPSCAWLEVICKVLSHSWEIRACDITLAWWEEEQARKQRGSEKEKNRTCVVDCLWRFIYMWWLLVLSQSRIGRTIR